MCLYDISLRFDADCVLCEVRAESEEKVYDINITIHTGTTKMIRHCNLGIYNPRRARERTGYKRYAQRSFLVYSVFCSFCLQRFLSFTLCRISKALSGFLLFPCLSFLLPSPLRWNIIWNSTSVMSIYLA
jgi:hypothetical protein